MQKIIKGRFLSVGELLEFLRHFPEHAKVGPFDRGKSAGIVIFNFHSGHTQSMGFIECQTAADIIESGDQKSG